MSHWKQLSIVAVVLSVACGGKIMTDEIPTGHDAGVDPVESGLCNACASDEDCQRNCAPMQGGSISCCDVGSGVCFALKSATCPVTEDAAVD